ncbi:Uncharacterised protein [Vibrio cholerae]|nr:Uncharacterised protein [Vibrio cholerae]
MGIKVFTEDADASQQRGGIVITVTKGVNDWVFPSLNSLNELAHSGCRFISGRPIIRTNRKISRILNGSRLD